MPTFLRIAWFLIAGSLLLGQTAALAQTYLRENKNGVIYYYFPNRDRSQPRATAVIAGANQKVSLKPQTKPALQRAQAPTPLEAPSPQVTAYTAQLVPERTEESVAVNPYDPKGMVLTGTRYIVSLLAKMGYRYPMPLPKYALGPQAPDRYRERPCIQEAKLAAPGGWEKILKDAAQEPLFLMGQVNQGPNGFSGPGQLLYSFPVAGPFSFKDSWGDPRDGGVRMHRAVDIFAPEGSAVYAITSGVIDSLSTSSSGGITLFLQGQDGKGYGYMHLQGYAAGIVQGKLVRTGELIGYVGRTGMTTSQAHLHLQVYADHRLCKDELLNPYYFLVQLCHGVGVTDLYEHKIARLENPETRFNPIQVSRRPGYATLNGGVRQFNTKDSSVLVIKNY